MSIVAAIMVPQYGCWIYGDKRGITFTQDGPLTRDNILKIHSISSETVVGITGLWEWGIGLIEHLKASEITIPSRLISLIENFTVPDNTIPSTVTFCGIYDNGDPFLFTYETLNKSKQLFQQTANCSIATNPMDLVNECTRYLNEQLKLTGDPELTLKNTIKHASILKPATICEQFDAFFIPRKSFI